MLALAIGLTRLAHAAGPDTFQRYGGITPEGLHAVGPPLTALRTKLADPNWLVAWLLKPAHLRQQTLMREFNVSVDDARAMAKYLYGGELPPPRRRGEWQGGDARLGKSLFVTRGCRGCHAIRATETSVTDRVPNLAGIGLKVRGDWLFNWLKSPRAYDPNTPMPQLVLSNDDIRHLVAFLLSRRDGAEAIARAPRFDRNVAPEAGQTAIMRFDCPKCHLIPGFQTVTPTNARAFLARSCTSCHEPSESSGSPGSAAEGDSNPADATLRNGRLLVAFYNCRGCHRIESNGGPIADYLERKTFAPPVLDGEGARVQTSWLVEFLQRPTPLRPWLQLRMPNYGFSPTEATALATYFAALAHTPAVDEPLELPASWTTELGTRRFAHFKCVQCHPANPSAQPPEGVDPEDLSINLMLVKTRLRPSWVRDFLTRPKAIVGTGTRMPAVFYTTDGDPKVEHPERDIAALTAYLFTMTEPPATSVERVPATPQTDWSTYSY